MNGATSTAAGIAHPSHWQTNRVADDAGVSCADCFHPKHAHNDDGRCRARRHRCPCREFRPQTPTVRVGAAQ